MKKAVPLFISAPLLIAGTALVFHLRVYGQRQYSIATTIGIYALYFAATLLLAYIAATFHTIRGCRTAKIYTLVCAVLALAALLLLWMPYPTAILHTLLENYMGFRGAVVALGYYGTLFVISTERGGSKHPG